MPEDVSKVCLEGIPEVQRMDAEALNLSSLRLTRLPPEIAKLSQLAALSTR